MDKPEADGLTPYTLGRAYGEHAAGAVIRVDLERKKWLDENEYQGEIETPALKPRSKKVVADGEISQRFPITEILTPPFESEG